MAQEYTERTNKFKHLYGQIDKNKFFQDVRNPSIGGECSGIQCSDKFFAFAERGIKLHVNKLEDYGRIKADGATISAGITKGNITDFAFNPFMSNMVAVAGNSGRVAVVVFPKDGLTDSISDATVDLGQVHGKSCVILQYHPCASNVLASAAFDKTVKLYDIEKNAEIIGIEGAVEDNIFSMEFNQNGSLIATTSRDRKLRLYDPRDNINTTSEVPTGFQGKSSKTFFAPRMNWVGVCGFNDKRKRTVKIWDQRKLDKEIFDHAIDAQSSVIVPFFDDDNGVLFLAEKGSGTVSWWELVNDDKKAYPLGSYRNNVPAKGGGWVPKRSLDVWQCEVQRYMRLTGKTIEPVSLIVPRKAGADNFQEDIFPDCVSNKPAMKADEWLNGGNKEALRMPMDPSKRTDNDDDSGSSFVKKMTYSELEKDNDRLRKYIKELEAKLGGDAGGDYSSGAAAAQDDTKDDNDDNKEDNDNNGGGDDDNNNDDAANDDDNAGGDDNGGDDAGGDDAGGDDAGGDDAGGDDAGGDDDNAGGDDE